MPDFKITLPDGASYKVTAPDEGTAYSALQTSLAGQPKAEAGRGGVLPSFAEGFATGFTDIPLGIAGLFTARPEETTAGKFSLGARDVIQDILGIDPTKEATMAETGASALGSIGSFLVPGLGAVKVAKGIGMGVRGAGAAGSVAGALQGAALGSGEQAQRAMAQEQETGKQVSDEARRSAQLLGGAIGLSEILPLQKFLGPLEAILAKVPLSKASVVADIMQTGITRAAKSATAEGAQEAISQLAQNLVESGLYNPELNVTEGLLGNAAAGGFAGGTVDAILQLMAGRKIRKANTARGQLETQIDTEVQEAAPEIVRAQAIEGINTLRTAAPTGAISVIESQMPGDEKPSYYIVGADKKPLAKFDSIDAAIAVGKQYEADSSGAVKFEPPTITELVKMKKAKEPKLTKAQKNQARQEAKRLKAAGQLQPTPTTAPATTPEGQATTVASIEKATTEDNLPASVAAEAPVVAPAKGRKKLAPVEAPVPGAVLPPIDTAAEIKLPEQPAAPELTADQRVAIWKSIAPQAESFRDLTPEQQATYFEELKKAQPPADQASKLSTAPTPTPAPEAAAPPATTEPKVPEGFRQVKKEVQPTIRVALRPLESTPEGAAKAAEMDAKKGRVADALNKVLAPIVAKDVRLNLVSHLKEGETYARGAVNPEGTVINLALDIYDPALTEEQLIDKLMQVMNHEVIHTLKNANLLTPAEVATLFNATDKIKYQGKAFTYFDRAYRTYATIESYTTVNESGDRIPNMDMINEEAVAEMFRDYRSGKLKIGEKPKGIFNKIIQLFKRMFRSFRDAEVGKVFTRIESGEVGARQGVAAPAGAAPKFSVAPAVGSDEFKRWFRNGVAVNEDGSPKAVYHATESDKIYDEFDTTRSEMGTHFGTQSQAQNILDIKQAERSQYPVMRKPPSRVIPVYINLQNPIRLIDLGQWNPDVVLKQLEEDGIIDPDEYDAIYEETSSPSEKQVHSLLRKLGYDGIVYLNRFEGTSAGMMDARLSSDEEFKQIYPNASDSYIIFNPTQAKSIFNQFEPGTATSKKLSVAPSAYEAVPFVERPAAVQKQILGDVERMRRKANDIAKDVVRKGDTNFDNAANAANIEVRNAVRKLSAIPQPQPQSAFFEAANATLFASTPTPTSTGERLMDLLGGLGTSAGRTKILDAFRVNYVQKQGQIAKYQRVAELAGKLESGMAQYSAVASSEMADRSSHQIPLIIEFGAGEVMMVNNDPNSKYFVVNQNEMENAPKEFFKLVYTGGPNGTSLMDQFKTILVARAVVKRQSEGKQTPIEVTPEYIKRAEDLALQYPVLEDAYGRYQKFNKKMIKAAMDAGVISQDTFENFTDDMNYYSLYREVGDEILSPEPYGATGRATKIKAYKGSDQGKLIADPMEAMIRNISFWTAATMRNIAAQKAYRVAKEVGISRKLNWQGSKLGWEDPDPKRGEDARYLSYNIDGKEFRYAVTDPLFATGLLNTEGHNMGLALELLGMPTTALRELVTRDPGFMIANLLRDSMSTWILAGSGASPLGTFIGMKKALMNDVSYQSLKRMAVVGSYDEAQKSPRQMVAGLKAGIVNAQGLNGTVDVLKYGWDRLGKLSDASDAATRIAVYEAAIKDGVDEYTAAYRALSVMNFSRRGASMGISVATKLIPFLNARIQGFDVLYTGIKAGVQLAQGAEQTAFEKQRGAAVWYRGAGLMASALALAMLNEDDEDYKQIPQYIKDANFLVPIGGSKFISIPKPFEAGLIFGTVPTTLYDIMRGNRSTRSGIKLFTSQLGSTFGFNPMPQVALPLFENLTNSDFYTGMPLISPGMQKLDPSLQYNSSTSYVARSLGKLLAYTPFGYDFESGKFEGVSPIMIDNLITGYGGPIGGYVSMGIGGLIGAFGQDNQGIPIAGSNLPVIKRFFIDAQDKQPQAAAEAYEVYQLVDKATRTASRLKKMGDVEALKEFREENIDLLRVGKQVRKMAENLNNIRAQVRRLEVDTTMSGSEKKERMRELRAREIQITRKIDAINEKLGR